MKCFFRQTKRRHLVVVSISILSIFSSFEIKISSLKAVREYPNFGVSFGIFPFSISQYKSKPFDIRSFCVLIATCILLFVVMVFCFASKSSCFLFYYQSKCIILIERGIIFYNIQFSFAKQVLLLWQHTV